MKYEESHESPEEVMTGALFYILIIPWQLSGSLSNQIRRFGEVFFYLFFQEFLCMSCLHSAYWPVQTQSTTEGHRADNAGITELSRLFSKANHSQEEESVHVRIFNY